MSQTERIVYALPFVPKTAKETADDPVLRQVAGYARVSTSEEEQQNSYEAQIEYYTNYIKSHEGWAFAGMYADEGISGTNTKRRSGFNRMIQDALDGKINLIITKSVSRFARNTVDSLTTVRLLKEKGVEVFFEKENIFTLDSKGELLITIMSSLAQEESRSISENVRWGLRRRFAAGQVIIPYKHFLGYEKGEDGIPKIVKEEAKLVERIYTHFLDGMTPSGIADMLTREGIPSPAGKSKWYSGTVKSILTNEKYRGSALLQKTYVVDFLTKEKKINDGEVQQYYVEESHPAIITPEMFELVKFEMKNRQADSRHHSNVSCFSNRLVCAQCGNYYGRKVWHSTSKYRRFIWQCGHKFKGGDKCATPHLYEDEVKAAFLIVVERLTQNRDEILVALEAALAILADTEDIDRNMARAVKKEQEVARLMRGEVEQNAHAAQDQADYNKRYSELTERFNTAHAETIRLTEMKAKRSGRALRLTAYLDTLRRRDSLLTEFDEGLWVAVVQDVTVRENGDMTFRLRDGSEQEYVRDV